MEVLECILTRQSIRTYDKKDVPNELIGQILEAGVHAPSAGNMQPWEFIIVKDKKIKKEIADAALRQRFIDEAPVLIIVCADPEKSGLRYRERGKTLYSFQDTAAAIENMLLTAKALGLGGCWVGAFEEEKVKSILRIPAKLRPVAILSIGFPIPYEKPTKTPRIPFENITWVDRYGEGFSWIEKFGKEWKFKIRPLEEHVRKLKEKLTLSKK